MDKPTLTLKKSPYTIGYIDINANNVLPSGEVERPYSKEMKDFVSTSVPFVDAIQTYNLTEEEVENLECGQSVTRILETDIREVFGPDTFFRICSYA